MSILGENPWAQLFQIQRDMDYLFNSLQTTEDETTPSQQLTKPTTRSQRPTEGTWKPVLDVKEKDDSFLVETELPGLEKKDVKIELKEGLLTIRGDRIQKKKDDNEVCHRIERSYGKFERTVKLPSGIDPSGIKACFNNGVLHVCIPKPAHEEKETLTKHVEQLTEEVKTKHEKIEELTKHLEESKIENEKLTTKTQEQEKHIEELNKQLTTAHQEKEELTKKVEHLNKEVETRDEQIKTLNSDISTLKSQLDALTQENQKIKGYMKERDDHVKDLFEKFNSHKF